MALGGIIAGALGGAAQQGIEVANSALDKQKQMDLRQYEQQLTMERAEQQERLRQAGVLAEVKGPIADARVEYDGRVTKQRVSTETAGLVERERTLAPVKVESAKQIKRAENDIEQENLRNYGKDPEARKGARAMAEDKESSASRTAAAAAGYKLGREKQVDVLRDAAARTRAAGNEEGAKALLQQAADMSGAGNTKSYSDVVQAGRVLADMAKAEETALRENFDITPEEKKAAEQRIAEMRATAAALAGGVAEKKNVSTGGSKADPQAGPKPAPAVGTVMNGYRYMGGDPNVRANWVKAGQSAAGSVK